LKILYTNNGNEIENEAPLINNKYPEIKVPKDLCNEYKNTWKEFVYKNINLPILYTGSILITKDFIWDRYVHMGFQSPFSYKNVIQLIFDEGKLIKSKDLSNIAQSIRDKNIDFPNDYNNDNYFGNMINWINDCFDISFDKKVNNILDNTK